MKKINVQLCKQLKKIPEGDFLFEIKYDGYRIIAIIENNKVKLLTRNKKDYTSIFKEISSSLSDFFKNREMILDGEVVAVNKSGKTDFQTLQNHLNTKNGNLTYMIFDLLSLDGIDLRGEKLIERKKILEKILKNAPENLLFSQHILGNGNKIFEESCKNKLEGIIGKKINSPYSGTRNGDWVKIKCEFGQEFVIGGYTKTKKTRGISALLLGYYKNDDLIFVGRVGTGMSEKEMKDLEKQFALIQQNQCPFKNSPKISKNEEVIFLKIKHVAQIKFAEITKDGLLRQASYKGLRTDKNPKEVVLEQ